MAKTIKSPKIKISSGKAFSGGMVVSGGSGGSAAAKQYTDESIAGISGVLAGKNCTVQSVTAITGGHRVVLAWTADNGTQRTESFDVMDGENAVQIAGITVNANNQIVFTMADGRTYVTAAIPTVAGYSPQASVERVSNGAKVTVTDQSGTTSAVASDGVSPTVSVARNQQNNGVILTITDVDGEHTATINDGSVSASVDYANVNNKPKINNVEVSGNKALADYGINIPTRNSQLLNDSSFITASDLPTIDTALSAVSSNPVTNAAITTEIRATQSSLNDTIVDVGANTDAITVLNGNATVNGSVAKQIQDALSNLDRLTKQIVAELPPVSSAIENVIYLIPNQSGTAYEQWTVVDDGQGGRVYAQLGSTDTDLTGYYTSAQVDSLLGDKQATIAGAASSVTSLNLATNRAVVSDSNGKLSASTITSTELEALDDVSGNIQDQLDSKQDALTFDSTPTNASTNPVTSGGVYTALQGKQDTLTFDNVPTSLSNNPVKSGGVYSALVEKQDVFQVSTLPVPSSANVGTILQYVGAETGGLVNGGFYRCELNPDTATYEWNEFVPFAVPQKTSDITNDSGFITNTVSNLVNYYLKSETYSKSEVDVLIGAISTMHIESVSTLPTTGIQTNVIYLVPSSSSQTSNIKDEYINLDGTTSGWEIIGSTGIDLTGYVTEAELNTALADYTTTTALLSLLRAKAAKVDSPTANNFATLKADGNMADSGISKDIIPSTATSSNKLATESDVKNAPITVFKASSINIVDFNNLIPDDLTISSRNIFMVVSDGTNVANSPRSTRNMIVICYNTVGNVTRQNQVAISEDGTKQMWQRTCTGGTWSTWTEYLSTDSLTSSVTSGSTAPITSGGVYDTIHNTMNIRPYIQTLTSNAFSKLLGSVSNDWNVNSANVLIKSFRADGDLCWLGNVQWKGKGVGNITDIIYSKIAGVDSVTQIDAQGTLGGLTGTNPVYAEVYYLGPHN